MKVKLLIVGIALLVGLVGCSGKPQTTSLNSSSKEVTKNNDTLENTITQKQPKKLVTVEKDSLTVFEQAVASNEGKIEKYYALVHKFKQREFDAAKMANWEDKINQEFYSDLAVVSNDLSKFYINQSMLIKAKKVDRLKEVQAKKKELIAQEQKIHETRDLLLKKLQTLKEYQKAYELAAKSIQEKTTDLLGEVTFTYNKETYTAYVADLSQHKIATHLTNNGQHLSKLSNLKGMLEKENKAVLMVTNAGMFHYTKNPVGLFIEEGKEKFKINLEPENGDNFHLAPNGVFYIDEKGAGIQETNVFLKAYNTKKVIPISATQSGPMLVIDGKHHYKFNHGSKSRKLRSGVGLLPNNRIVFIISDRHNTNFFQFGTIFKDLFACQQALFLDGAISEMYIKGNSKNLKGGNFGPMLSIIKK